MPSNYRPIGDYVKRVERRNKDLKVTKLFGLSMTKEFRETTSNIVGTDMSVYRVMHKHEFACDFMSPIRVNKLPVVLKLDDEPNLVSPAYPVFKVKDSNLLDPEYLMMWFRRSEFDRYATFKCDAAIRGGYDWQALCETLIPVPSIEKQREIVAEYHTIQTRIALNNQLIQTLETTAQAIYKRWFVEFEFPNEAGQPYKSSGGEMVDSGLGEIPKGWEVMSFTRIVKLSGGGTPSTDKPEYWDGDVPFYTPGDLNKSYFSIETEKSITSLGLSKCSSKLYPKHTIFVTARGATVGGVGMAGIPMAMNQTCYAISGKTGNSFFAHQLTMQLIAKLKTEAIGATFEALVTKDFDATKATQPASSVMSAFESKVRPIYDLNLSKTRQNHSLKELSNLLLSKLATIETAPKPAATGPAQLTLSFA